MLDEARIELGRRMDGEVTASKLPTVVLVIGELADVGDDGTTLEMLGTHGPAHGIHLLAASTDAAALGEGVLAHFRTRMVLQLLDEEQSVHLLGQPGADELDGGGDLLARIDTRAAIHARGFRVAPEHLDELTRLMGEAYPAAAASQPVSADPDDVHPSAGAGEPDDVAAGDEPATAAAIAEEVEPAPIDEPDPVRDPPPPGGGGGPRMNGHYEPAPSANGDAGHVVTTTEAAQPNGALHLAPAKTTPIRVVCFGGPRVMHGEREIWPADKGSGPNKRWEALVFLACQPKAVVTRDKLQGALWPENGGPDALRTALSRLRLALSVEGPRLNSEIVHSDRHGVYSLDTSAVSSDVHRFVALCEVAKRLPPAEAKEAYQEAHTLYQGDLLEERPYAWVDERDDAGGLTLREQYREMHRRAINALADLYLADGEAAAAAPLYKELLLAEPTLENVARQLFRCLALVGDRSGLVREERHLREALKGAYGYPSQPGEPARHLPGLDTTALFEQLLEQLDAETVPQR